ncbi:hypothetical protein T10_12909 [Trichinella papuae]|uniref:Uncharacterized protein n=1 Tax=Trichinella papuae TaxID=268474 RepID=A0A0V1M6I7_9BILA|nr:hypothetical protein T10_12909 [Trichinella papuae]
MNVIRTLANSSRSVGDCVTRICGSTTPTEVTLDCSSDGLRNTARPGCVLKVQQQGSRSYETPVPVDPERQLWRNRRSVDHELVPCCWNSRMPDNYREDSRLGFMVYKNPALDAFSPYISHPNRRQRWSRDGRSKEA